MKIRSYILLLFTSTFIIFFLFVGAMCGNSYDIDGDWVINDSISESNVIINVYGNLIIKNLGTLTLTNVTLNIVSSYDEEHYILLQGGARLETYNSTIQGVGGQTYIETVELVTQDETNSPTLDFNNSHITNHAGIRARGGTLLTSIYSTIEEFQVHDTAQAIITGGEVYPVLFFTDGTATFSGLRSDDNIDVSVNLSGGWSISIIDGNIWGWQIDLIDTANITLNNSDGITLSVHTPGNLGGEVTVSDITSDPETETSGSISSLGPTFTWNDTQIQLFNLYTVGNDQVRIINTRVNEPQCDVNSRITMEDCEVCFNLGQCYDYGNMITNNSSVVKEDPGDEPSCLTDDYSTMTFNTSDLLDLYLTAIDNSTIHINDCDNVDLSFYSVEDNGKIYVDGVQVLP